LNQGIGLEDIKSKVLRGSLAKMCVQATTFTLRVGSLMILGRLLGPTDFGLVGMVTAVIGVFNLFRDFGLSTATVQRAKVTHEQHSTLFWINVLAGAVLALVVLAAAPLMAGFYHEPRLMPVAAVLALGFLFNAAGVQHDALLQRQLRFTTAAMVEVVAAVSSLTVGITMALRGHGYWSLVLITITYPLALTVGYWVATGWIPGRPRRDPEILSMLRFGGTITLNGLIVYVGYNLEKVLLGRYWGAAALGIYGRAYQVVNIPVENLNSSAGSVAFPSLARLQGSPVRLRAYFLKGYALILGLTLPIAAICALYAEELISVVLGPKWKGTATVFRYLAPTVAIYAVINPMGWLLFALGMVGRSLRVAAVLAPVVICGYMIGLPKGPEGVALGYSAALTLWAIPHIAWCVHGTVVSLRDILMTIRRPLIAALGATVLPLVFQWSLGHHLGPLSRLLGGGILFSVGYLVLLFEVMGQRSLYLDVLRSFRGRSVRDEEVMVSA
jgi:O-antigen/teichoic acid export membrane protein